MKLQREIQESLLKLLLGALFPDGQQRPFGVLTTAPGQWLPLSTSANISIIDITEMTGPTIWVTEIDIRDRVLNSIKSAGWPDKQVKIEHRTSSFIADIVLDDSEQRPLAVLECRSDPKRLMDTLDQARRYAKSLNAKFAIATDGTRFLLGAADVSQVHESSSVPTPQLLGQTSLGPSKDETRPSGSGGSIIRPRAVNDLSQILDSLQSGNIIVDHTLPWNDRDSVATGNIRGFLGEVANSFRHLDSLMAVLLLAVCTRTVERIITLLPRGLTFASQHSAFRDFIVSRIPLAGTIDLPGGLFLPFTNVPCNLVAFGIYPIRSADKIAMIDVSSRGRMFQLEDQVWFHDFKNGLLGKEMTLGRALLDKKQPWGISAIIEMVVEGYGKRVGERLQKLAESIQLGELCEVILGFKHSRDESKPQTGIAVIRGRDLSAETLSKESISWFKVDKPVPDKVKLVQGDVLIQRIGSRPQSIVVGSDLEGTIASDTVIILRPKDGRANPRLICQFLRSTVGQGLVEMGNIGGYAPTTSISYLKTIPIPLFQEHITCKLEELQQMEQDLKVRAEKIEAMRLNLFSAESGEDLENRLAEIRRMASVVNTSMQQAETREFQIRNFYPFPLAFCYRSLSSYTHLHELYPEQLNVAENILAFLASITLALTNPEDRKSTGLVLQDLWRGGVSFGKWRQVCQTGAESLERYDTNHLAKRVAGIWRGKKQTRFAKSIEELVVARNDFYHGRGPKIDGEFRVATDNVTKLLDDAMGELAFFTEYPIRLVRDFNVVRGTRRVILQALKYVGDHPGMRQEQTEYKEALTKNDLYLQLRDDDWLPLYPFLTVQVCPTCRNRETYYIDRWDGVGKKTILKSFERGHTEDDKEIGDGINAWQNA